MPRNLPTAMCLCSLLAGAAFAGNWVEYSNETSLRLVTTDSAVGAADTQEKEFAFGDVDQDGDLDMVVARKNPFTTTGGRRNVLYMNEGVGEGHSVTGVLVDRTVDYIPDFMDLTNDRDIQLADLNGDGWLDVVTATTLGGLSSPKEMTHPRIYINQGDDVNGDWQGFVYDDVDRIPTFPTEPRFCGVAAGDVDNDGDLDLYFVDYDQGPYNRPIDLNDRLLINNGVGYFTDESAARMTAQQLSSSFGTAVEIADLNGNGWRDVVKSGNGPVRISYNGGNGLFQSSNGGAFEEIYTGAAYHVNVGYLNNDGMLDLVVSDDGFDRYFLNQGNGGDGLANWSNNSFASATNGFGSDNYVVDLDNDNINDVIITDVDVDIPGCTRTTHIVHNVGNPSFVIDAGNIPQSMRTGSHDVAAFDINGDGYKDLVFGRCSGTQVWVNAPPVAIEFAYPQGVPNLVDVGVSTTIDVQVTAVGDVIVPESPSIHLSMNDGPFTTTALSSIGPDLYQATLPAGDCGDRYDFYFSAQLSGGLTFTDPPTAPVVTYTALATEGASVLVSDDIEGDVSGWTIVSDPSLTSGEWEQADPNATIFGGQLVQPENDATSDGTLCFITENGPPGGGNSANDVDFGPTHLLSPVLDLAGTDAFVQYSAWVASFTGIHDAMSVAISADGGATWVPVETVSETNQVWEVRSFLVGAYVEPTNQVRVRFSISDSTNDSATEAGVDDFFVSAVCGSGCPEDLDGDDIVGITDLLMLLSQWGGNPGGPPDFDNDGVVGIADLLVLLANWGPCK